MAVDCHSCAPETVEDLVALAAARAERAGERLTKQRRTVLKLIFAQHGPVSAYDLVGEMSKAEGRQVAPVTIYRALDFLARLGLVSKLESRNAFVLCAHPEEEHDCVFLVCRTCGEVAEIVDTDLMARLDADVRQAGFQPERRVIEVHGVCSVCGA